MKSFIKYIVPATWLLCLTACQDLTELNVNPNQLGADEINAKYVLTSALAQTANFYIRDFTYGYTSEHGISESMQYLQRDYIGYEINSFVWKPTEYNSFGALNDSQTLLTNSESVSAEEARKFYQGVASVLRAFWFGFYSSAWGDVPYQEALQGDAQMFKPLYNQQKDVFKGIIEELKSANEMLSGLGTIPSVGSSDILFAGNAAKWRKFANALRVRYYLRLGAKKEELKPAGLDIAADLNAMLSNPTQYPLPESNADNAAIAFPGTDAFTSWIGGPLANSNRSQFYRRKPCSTIIDHLKQSGDPRLTTWFRPVDVQLKVGSGSAEYVKGPAGQLIRYVAQYNPGLDTSLYVGLKPALGDPNLYNLGSTANLSQIKALNSSLYLDQGANPHVSYLADRYAQNTHAQVKSVLMSYSELNFLLSEAALNGWVTADAAGYFRRGIEASLDQYQLSDGVTSVYNRSTHQLGAFDRSGFLGDLEKQFRNIPAGQLELLMTQKWVALWMTPEFWFDWRRTGLPKLGKFVVEGSNGDKIPVRLIYGAKEYIVNEPHVREAVSRLQPQTDDQWSKMWLLQGGSQPW
ncbi:SusD/RagB family nutrient-binding outer membrane lipoprotein [Ravibacter arvi]|uniref:SusD/RagB family nutrient-binding outer membrane lipoprotein n=1 Tax=Ravibacter arvi TaxID=2051041 RepID=A0ABP8LRV5_9BACT